MLGRDHWFRSVVSACVTYRLCAEDGLAAGFCAHAGEWAEGVVGEDVDSLDLCARVRGVSTNSEFLVL